MDQALIVWRAAGAASYEHWPVVFEAEGRILCVVADLFGRLPGLAPELVRGGVLRALLGLVRHPVFGSRDADMAEEYDDDNVAKEYCNQPMQDEYAEDMTTMVDVLRVCAKHLPQVRSLPWRLPSPA